MSVSCYSRIATSLRKCCNVDRLIYKHICRLSAAEGVSAQETISIGRKSFFKSAASAKHKTFTAADRRQNDTASVFTSHSSFCQQQHHELPFVSSNDNSLDFFLHCTRTTHTLSHPTLVSNWHALFIKRVVGKYKSAHFHSHHCGHLFLSFYLAAYRDDKTQLPNKPHNKGLGSVSYILYCVLSSFHYIVWSLVNSMRRPFHYDSLQKKKEIYTMAF